MKFNIAYAAMRKQSLFSWGVLSDAQLSIDLVCRAFASVKLNMGVSAVLFE